MGNDYEDVPPIAFLEIIRQCVVKQTVKPMLLNRFDAVIHELAELYEQDNALRDITNDYVNGLNRKIAALEQENKNLRKHNEDLEDQIIELVGDIDKLETANEQARDAARAAALAAGISPGDA